jgi:hypothetical protein
MIPSPTSFGHHVGCGDPGPDRDRGHQDKARQHSCKLVRASFQKYGTPHAKKFWQRFATTLLQHLLGSAFSETEAAATTTLDNAIVKTVFCQGEDDTLHYRVVDCIVSDVAVRHEQK